MRNITEFEKWKVTGPRIAGASVTKTAKLLGFSRTTISRTMNEFKKKRKISRNQSNSGRILKLTDRDESALKRIV